MYNNNYYPNYNYYPYPNKRHFGKYNWSNFLNGAQKTLNFVNQAIPVFYQLKPLYENAKTAFKVVNIIKSDNNHDNKKQENIVKDITNNNEKKVDTKDRPTYFL